MTNARVLSSDFMAACEAALRIGDEDDRSAQLKHLALEALKCGDSTMARKLFAEMPLGMNAFWVMLELFVREENEADLKAFRQIVAASGDEGPDLVLFFGVIRSCQRNEAAEALKLARQMEDALIRTQALKAIREMTGATPELLALMANEAQTSEVNFVSFGHATLEEAAMRAMEAVVTRAVLDAQTPGFRPSRLERRRARLANLLEHDAPDVIVRNEARLVIEEGDFETVESLFSRFAWSRDDEDFRSGFACGHAARSELDEARHLASGLTDPALRSKAYLTIYRSAKRTVS